MNFTQKDVSYIESLGIDVNGVEKQLQRYKNGFPDIQLFKEVSPDNGLWILTQDDLINYVQFYQAKSIHKKLIKFVPASGAASRMFKLLYNYLEDSSSVNSDIDLFFKKMKDFAFSDELLSKMDRDNVAEMVENRDPYVIEQLLLKTGLNYGELPKALLSFHEYTNGNINKAIDEHLLEGALYCCDKNDSVALHFTVSKEHQKLIEKHLETAVKKYEKRFKKKYAITFSIQDVATNTIAVDLNNQPFRLDNGELLSLIHI